MARDLGRGKRARRSHNADPRFAAGALVVQAWARVVALEPGTSERQDAEFILAACLNELAAAYGAKQT